MTARPKDPVKFVKELQLSTPRSSINRGGGPTVNMKAHALESGEDAKAESYLSNKSIVSFASSVSGQNRQDILSSTLLAQLAASKKHPGEEDLEGWFKDYQNTLQNVGWVVQGSDFSKFSQSGNVFEMQNVIIDLLSAALGGNVLTILTKTLEAFKKLSDTDSKIVAFEKNTHTLTKGTFIIALCDGTNDAVAMKTGAFELSSSNTITQILFFTSSKEKTSLSYSTSDATFNKKAYDAVRNTIEQKLADKFNQYVAELDI